MTAVEWLRKELQTIPDYSVFYTRNYQWIDSIMNEAKEMEKQQIIEAHTNGHNYYEVNGIGAEQYYNEIFKNTKE
jgi:hypothetical protein